MLLTTDPLNSISEQVQTSSQSRQELRAARDETDRLFQLITPENIYVRPLPQRHRLIFYLGHLEAFDWNQLGRLTLQRGSLHPVFDQLFERGIDPEAGQLPADQPSDWPALNEAQSYVRHVRDQIDSIWELVPADVRQMALEHRWMHAETLAYLLHNLPHEQKRRPFGESAIPLQRGTGTQKFINIPRGIATLGHNSGFGWDNEFSEHVVEVPAFAISQFKVTNGDYLDYVKLGNPAPHFWELQRSEWYYRGMFESVKLPVDAPVYVTQEQAAAFAKWRGSSLLTEAQFHRAAYGTPDGREQFSPWARADPQDHLVGNFNFRHWDPVSVFDYPDGTSAFGVAQLVGNGWEWTQTPFAPFAGFAPEPHYPGYSADFFDNKHFVLKGASPRTAAVLTRRSLRNWFRPDYPYLYATFRLVNS